MEEIVYTGWFGIGTGRCKQDITIIAGVQDTKIKIKNDDIKIIKNKYINELFK